MSEVVQKLLELIDIPSETGREGRICTSIAQELMPLFGQEGVNRISNSLVVGQRTGKPMISLYGHLDTVPNQGQGPAYEQEGRIHGLGSSDMKSGLAVMIELMKDPEVREGPYDVVAVFYEAEEGPMAENGLEKVLAHTPWLASSEVGIVLEPTDLAIELGCNGVLNATASFEGKAAHSARPWLGENAIMKAGLWLDRMNSLEPEPIDVGGLDFIEVIGVTKASGGVANNVVPASFECNLNYRFSPAKSIEEATAHLMEVASEGPDKLEVHDVAPAGPVAAGNPHVTRLAEASSAVFRPKQGWTDVARLAEYGVPGVNYGPGEPDLAHMPNESVKTENLELALDALWKFLTKT